MAKHRRTPSEPAPRRAKRSIWSYPALVPVLGLWGAMLGMAMVLMLPAPVVSAVAGAGDGARLLAAGMAALTLGGLCAVAALLMLRRTQARASSPDSTSAEPSIQRYRTINPARDLGSESFDAPLEAMPFAALSEALAETAGDPQPGAEAEPDPKRAEGPYGRWRRSLKHADHEPEHNVAPASEAAESEPAPSASPQAAGEAAALDLDQFASIPEPPPGLAGQESAPQADAFRPRSAAAPFTAPPAPVPDAAPAPPHVPRALARLRAVPPSELSMVQLVERFAAALHQRQEPGLSGARPASAAREAALAEALRELAEMTGESAQADRIGDDELHAALRRLQHLRGAA